MRWYSKALPWNSFVPVRVTTLTAAPEFRPYSAEKLAVLIETSSMKSMPTLLIWLLFEPESMLKPPSTVSSVAFVRLPLIEVLMPRPVMMSSAFGLRSGAPGMRVVSCR